MCRVSEPVLVAEASSKAQTHLKKVKQRLAKLQRKQWASGVVSFASKVRFPTPGIDAYALVCCCKLFSGLGLRGVGAAACHADAEQQCKDAAECSSIEVAQGHSRRSPACQVCLTTYCIYRQSPTSPQICLTTRCAKDSCLL